MKNKNRRAGKKGDILLYLILTALSIGYLLPLLLMISVSFTSEEMISGFGYQLIPQKWSLEAYRAVFRDSTQILDSYRTTILYSLLSTVLAMFIQTLLAYPLARSNFRYKKAVTVYLMITMFFSGGLVPSYILNTQYLHMGNTFWIYVVPGLMSAWNVIMFKTFYQGLPDGLIEAAKIDGASEYRIYLSIIIPLAKPIIACLGFMYLLGKWNDWNTSLLYIRDSRLYSLQYLLQKLINEADFLKQMQSSESGAGLFANEEPPFESLRYAIAVVAAGPMMVVFPFFQKYFTRGLVVGSVKS